MIPSNVAFIGYPLAFQERDLTHRRVPSRAGSRVRRYNQSHRGALRPFISEQTPPTAGQTSSSRGDRIRPPVRPLRPGAIAFDRRSDTFVPGRSPSTSGQTPSFRGDRLRPLLRPLRTGASAFARWSESFVPERTPPTVGQNPSYRGERLRPLLRPLRTGANTFDRCSDP